MKAEFQRIARRDKKAFLSDQGKEEKERYTHLNQELQRRSRRNKKVFPVINAKK